MDALSGAMCMIMKSVFIDHVMLRPLLNRIFTEKLENHYRFKLFLEITVQIPHNLIRKHLSTFILHQTSLLLHI